MLWEVPGRQRTCERGSEGGAEKGVVRIYLFFRQFSLLIVLVCFFLPPFAGRLARSQEGAAAEMGGNGDDER